MDNESGHKPDVAHLEDDLHDLEAYMEEFTSFLPLAVCIVSAKQIIVDTNDAFVNTTGFGQKEAIGNYLSEFFVESERFESLLMAVQQISNESKETKLTLKTKEGKNKKTRVTIGPRRDTAGELTGYYVAIAPIIISPPPAPNSDTPKQVPVQSGGDTGKEGDATCVGTAAYEHQKNLAIIDGMRNGLIVLDHEGNIDTINAHAAEVMSVERDEICGKSVESLADREDLTDLVSTIKTVPEKSDKIKIGDLTYEVEVRETQTDNNQTYKLVMMHDISKDEFIEDMKLTFVTVAAHQIRTPLSSIRWSLEILINQLEDDEHIRIAQRGFRSTQNVLEIVNALLNLDRLQSGEDGYNFEPVDVASMLEEYVSEVNENNRIIEQADVNFKAPIDELPKVKADEEKIQIVIRNLIDNALKYTPADGSVNVETSVHVTNDYGNDMVQIEISDTGIGIPAESQDKIFSKFYRADNATKVKTDGTGIGLYISKQIVEEHDGTIWFESAEGEGTTFYIQLPIAQIQD